MGISISIPMPTHTFPFIDVSLLTHFTLSFFHLVVLSVSFALISTLSSLLYCTPLYGEQCFCWDSSIRSTSVSSCSIHFICQAKERTFNPKIVSYRLEKGKKLFVAATATATADAIINVITMCISSSVYLWTCYACKHAPSRMYLFSAHPFAHPSIAIDFARPLV